MSSCNQINKKFTKHTRYITSKENQSNGREDVNHQQQYIWSGKYILLRTYTPQQHIRQRMYDQQRQYKLLRKYIHRLKWYHHQK